MEGNATESAAAKWLKSICSTDSLPPECEALGYKESFDLRHLTVDRVEPGLLIATLTVKTSITNRYNTLHGGAVATFAKTVGLAAVKTLAGDQNYAISDMNMSYIYGARVGVELEIEAKVLRSGKNVAVSSIDIRNKDTKQAAFRGRITYYNMPTSRI